MENRERKSILFFLEILWRDLRYGARAFFKELAPALVVVLSLAIVIGMNLTVFTVFRDICFYDVTAQEPDSLRLVKMRSYVGISYPNYRDLITGHPFAGATGFVNTGVFWRNGESDEELLVSVVLPNFFEVIKVNAAQGRAFTSEEARPESTPQIVVLTHNFWRRLGSDPGILGKTLTLNGHPFTVIGVLQKDYRPVSYGAVPKMFVPLSTIIEPGLFDRDSQIIQPVLRLPEGMTSQQADAILEQGVRNLAQLYPSENKRFTKSPKVYPVSGFNRLKADSENGLTDELSASALIFGLVWLVLLIACTNLMAIFLVRAVHRRREIAIRMALGASRARLASQLLVESSFVAFFSSILGVLLSLWLADALSQIPIPAGIPYEFQARLDIDLLIYTFLIALACTLLGGLVPALRSARVNLVSELKGEKTQVLGYRFNIGKALVSGQVAFCTLLLLISLLFVESLVKLTRMETGFDTDGVVSVKVRRPPNSQTPPEIFLRQSVDLLGQIPELKKASFANLEPLTFSSRSRVKIRLVNDSKVRSRALSIGPNYFESFGIPLLAGREFGWDDRRGGQLVAIVNQTFAQLYFPNRDPIGQILIDGESRDAQILIVGLARNSKHESLGEAPTPMLYQPYLQVEKPENEFNLFAGITHGQPASSLRAIREALLGVDRSITIKATPIRDLAAISLFPTQAAAFAIVGFGITALVLAMIGLYGSTAFSVRRRTSELCMRMVLGATPGRVFRLVMKEVGLLVGIGVLVGLGAAYAAAQFISFFLADGVAPTGLLKFSGVGLLLFLISLLTTYSTARRAARVDLAQACRLE
jgi:predicted permease